VQSTTTCKARARNTKEPASERWRRRCLHSLTLVAVITPRGAGSGVVRIDPLRFLAGCRARRRNQALSVLSLSLDFLSISVVLLTIGPLFCVVLFCVICVFCHLVVPVRLSIPVQVIDWKFSSPKWSVMCWWGR